MLEDLGICAGSKRSEALVQSDTPGADLDNGNSDKARSLSGKFWSDELDDALSNWKQLETKQKVEERLNSAQDIRAALSAAAEAKEESPLMLDGEIISGKLSGVLKGNPVIIDCGFGRAFERQHKAEMDETACPLKRIELAPYFWNTLDSRR